MEDKINNKLLLEVNRLLSIMGVDEKLILEANVFDEVVDVARKLFRNVETIPNIPNKLLVNGEELSRTLFNKFKKVIDGEILLSALSQNELKTFAKILRSDDDLVNGVYDNILKKYLKLTPGSTEKDLIKNIKSRIDLDTSALSPGEKLSKVLKPIVNNDELALGILEQKFASKLRQLNTGKFNTEVKINTIPSRLGNKEGVIKFQKWLNETHPEWYKGGPLSRKNLGKYGESTANAWKKYKNEFLIPSSLKNEEGVKNFQKWMNEKYPTWYKGGKLPEKSFGLYGPNTENAWKRYQKEYNPSSFSQEVEKSAEKLRKGELPTLSPEKMNVFNTLASDVTFTNTVRKSLDFLIESIKTTFIGTEKQIDSIMSKIEAAINAKSKDAQEYDTLFRQIGIQIMSLKQKSSQNLILFLQEIEDAIIKTNKFDSSDVKYIMEKIKSESAWDNIFDLPKDKKKQLWLTKVINESSWANFMREMFTKSEDFMSGLLKKTGNLIMRSVMFLTTGHVRTINEIISFCVENGLKKGVGIYFAWLYVLKYLITPSFFGTIGFLWSEMQQLAGNPDYEETDLWTTLKKSFGESFSKAIGGGTLAEIINPFNWRWDNLKEMGDKNAQLEYAKETEEKLDKWAKDNGVTQEQLSIMKEKLKISSDWKKTVQELKESFQTGGGASIMNNKLGFITWCKIQKPPLTPDPANPWIEEPVDGMPQIVNKYGFTTDGTNVTRWEYNFDKKTFVKV